VLSIWRLIVKQGCQLSKAGSPVAICNGLKQTHSLSGLIFPKFVNGLADPELFLRRQLKIAVRWVHGAVAKGIGGD
jgi:hypothetical protein